jgi:hypothetical protein
VIIIYGLQSWNNITSPAGHRMPWSLNSMPVNSTGQRVTPVADGGLGATDFRLINGNNPLGIVTKESVATVLRNWMPRSTATDSLLAHAILAETKTGRAHRTSGPDA